MSRRRIPPAEWRALMRASEARRPIESPLLLVCPLEGCEVPMVGRVCPHHCTKVSCPTRHAGAPILPWLRGLLYVVNGLRSSLPPPPPVLPQPQPGSSGYAGVSVGSAAAPRRLLLITTTFQHVEQLLRLENLATILARERNILWIVVEDALEPSRAVGALLRQSHLAYVHLAHGPTHRGGNAQRNAALKHIRDARLDGVVYNLDDDNGYDSGLWSELRRVGPRRVAVLAVRRGVFPPPRCDGRFLPLLSGQRRTLKLERPVYDNATGRFVRFQAGWCGRRSWMSRRYGVRRFCVDMGGFAFDAALLRALEGDLWSYQGHGGESELIEKLLGPSGRPEDLQPLANCGQVRRALHSTASTARQPKTWMSCLAACTCGALAPAQPSAGGVASPRWRWRRATTPCAHARFRLLHT